MSINSFEYVFGRSGLTLTVTMARYSSSDAAPRDHSNKSKNFLLRAPDTEIWPFLCLKVILFKNENFSVCVILGEKQLDLFFSSFFQKY